MDPRKESTTALEAAFAKGIVRWCQVDVWTGLGGFLIAAKGTTLSQTATSMGLCGGTALERMRQTEPELHGSVVIDRLRNVEPDDAAFDQAEPRDVDAQAEADGVGNWAGLFSVDVGVPHVIEGRGVEVSHADKMVEHVPVEPLDQRHPPLQASDPDDASLALVQVIAAKQFAAS